MGARQLNEPELMGAAEAAEALGVTQTNVRTVSGFKEIEPYQRLKATPLYRAADVWALADRRSLPADVEQMLREESACSDRCAASI